MRFSTFSEFPRRPWPEPIAPEDAQGHWMRIRRTVPAKEQFPPICGHNLRGRKTTQGIGREARKAGGVNDEEFVDIMPQRSTAVVPDNLQNKDCQYQMAAGQQNGRHPLEAAILRPQSLEPSLPPELIYSILSLVLHSMDVSGRTYLFINDTKASRKDPWQICEGTSVCQFVKHQQSPTIDISRYALVCSGWRDIAYGLFYGHKDNSFHFSIGVGHVHWVGLQNPDSLQPDWWVQVLPSFHTGRARSPGSQSGPDRREVSSGNGFPIAPLNPLMDSTAKFVRNATLGLVPRGGQSRANNDFLLEAVEEAVRSFGTEQTNLQELRVLLHYSSEQRSMRLGFCPGMTSERVEDMSVDEEDHYEDEGRFDLTFKNEAICVAPRYNSTSRVLDPISRLRGLKKFSVGGLVLEGMAIDMAAAVMRDRSSTKDL